MKINDVKCDQCGHSRKAAQRNAHNITVYLATYPDPGEFDFCDEDCLREFLIKRKETEAERKAKADAFLYPSTPPPAEQQLAPA